MGKAEQLPSGLPPEDESNFKALVSAGYAVTSPKDRNYNCIAYAAGDQDRKWDPTSFPLPGYYWPSNASRGNGPDDLRAAFEAIGYEHCSGGHFEVDYEKVVLYEDNAGSWTHAARQIGTEFDVKWSGKLGDEEDISHNSEHCFGDSIYGSVVYYLRRAISSPEVH